MRLKSTLIATAAIAGFAMLGFATPAFATKASQARAMCSHNSKCSSFEIDDKDGGGIYCVGKNCVICINETADCITALKTTFHAPLADIAGILMQQSNGGAQPDTLNQRHGTTVQQAPASNGGYFY